MYLVVNKFLHQISHQKTSECLSVCKTSECISHPTASEMANSRCVFMSDYIIRIAIILQQNLKVFTEQSIFLPQSSASDAIRLTNYQSKQISELEEND